MRDSRVMTPYAEPCRNMEKTSDTFLCGASSLPGSDTCLYIPTHPVLYKYSINPSCTPLFKIPIIWKGMQKITPEYHALARKLMKLPLLSGSSVTYMSRTEGYFFNLSLKDNIRITISQYEDQWEEGIYVNVILDDEPVIQDFMSVEALVAMMMEFYDGSSN